MFKIFDEHYYIDLDSIEECTRIRSNDELSGDTENQIHVVKYETIKFLLEIIMTENEAIDQKLGMNSNVANDDNLLLSNSCLVLML